MEEINRQTCQDNQRFPDLHNLPKPRWRDAFRALLGPAQRVHDYRNLHRTESRLRRLLSKFRFAPMGSVLADAPGLAAEPVGVA